MPCPDHSAKHIVTLDDEAFVHDLFRLVLRSILPGAELRTFHQGDAALDSLRHCPPVLFITDLNHPGVSGHDLLTAVRQLPDRFPILIVSGLLPAWLQRDTDLQSLNVAFLHKPFTAGEFYTAIQKLGL